ncbi:TetR/AcrR family transcriptional regulator [Streptomyces sp. NPDC087903]|uniref:TetR/AcrR family transcriptional regulator n=1 Tax=Streptomyces sp. NPDC087903 TaxID=3365819 RepID=UPI0038010A46
MRLPTSASPTPPATAATSLTERRKAATRMEIARAAAGLFVKHGLRATRAEDIAQAAGIAPRTFYRYFATKEEAVAPLYAAGAQRWAAAVREAPADLSLAQALEHGVRHTLTPGVGVSASSWEWVRTLIRLAEASPALRKVWAEVCHTSERTLAEVLRERVTQPGHDDNVAERDNRVGAGAGAVPGSETGSGAGRGSGPATEPPVVLHAGLRFAAAAASAVVRTAVEGWAAGHAAAGGPEGPAAVALRNLAALRDFPWETVVDRRET